MRLEQGKGGTGHARAKPRPQTRLGRSVGRGAARFRSPRGFVSRGGGGGRLCGSGGRGRGGEGPRGARKRPRRWYPPPRGPGVRGAGQGGPGGPQGGGRGPEGKKT